MFTCKPLHFISLFLLIAPLSAWASPCIDVTNTINTDINKYANALKEQSLPWMKLSWLEIALGSVIAKNISEEQTKYEWRCDNNTGYLIAVADKNGNVQAVKGEYVTETGSGLFTADLAFAKQEAKANEAVSALNNVKPSEVEDVPNVPQPDPLPMLSEEESKAVVSALNTPKANSSAPNTDMKLPELTKSVLDYNAFYKTAFQHPAELADDIKLKLKNFYSNLRNCVPGIYQYAMPVSKSFLFNTTIIQKEPNVNYCHVETRYDIPHVGNVVVKCQYQQKHLFLFTDREAELAASGGSSFDAQHPSGIQQVTDKECKRYINGMS